MKTLRHCSIVAHIHDEVIVEADMRMSEEVLSEQMGGFRLGRMVCF
jgi:DNA polymerase